MREEVVLPDRTTIVVRSVHPEDADALAAGYEQLSATSAYRRFFTVPPRLSPAQVRYFTAVDHHDHEALGAVSTSTTGVDDDGSSGIGVARYIRERDDPYSAELAIVVLDSWQRRGVGFELLRLLCDRAREEGITRLRAEILADNPSLPALLRRFGPVQTQADGSIVSATLDLAPEP